MVAPSPAPGDSSPNGATPNHKSGVLVVSADNSDAEWLRTRLGMALKVTHCAASVDAVVEHITAEIAAVVVVFDARTDLTQATQIVLWLVKYRAEVTVLGMGYANSAKVPLAAFRSGVKDFLDIGAANVDEVRKPVWAACMRGEAPAKATPSGKVVALVGARSGMGVTTLAVHLTAVIESILKAGQAKKPNGHESSSGSLGVGLMDLGFPLCDGQMLLGLSASFHMVDAVQSLNRLDHAMLEAALPHHTSGIRTLSWPGQAQTLREVSPLSTSAVLQRMREFFVWQVVDVGGLPSADVVQEVMRHADHVWLVCDQSVGGIVSLSELMKQLRGNGQQSVHMDGLIVNRTFKGTGLPAADIAKRFGLPLLEVLPHREEVLLKASSAGMLLLETAPSDAYMQGVKQLAKNLLSASANAKGATDTTQQDTGKSWMKWLPRQGKAT